MEVWVFCLAGFLLVVVAATPSFGPCHELCTLALLVLVYSYFALLLYASGSAWLFVYLPAPVALALATRFHSYGLWQKTLIAYLVVLVNIHYHLVSRFRPSPPQKATGDRTNAFGKRRVAYVLTPGKSWPKRPHRRTEA